MRVLILGCGYVGLALGRRLVASGCSVVGLRRSKIADQELIASGIEPVQGDITCLADLDRLDGGFDGVINTVSSSRGGADVYRHVYLGGAKNLITWARDRAIRRMIYTSSTSVYGQTDGGWVSETDPAEAAGETGRLLLATESVFMEANSSNGMEVVVLRVGGIYGPDRGHLFRQFLAGEAQQEPGGGRWINMIHRDDVAGVIETVLRLANPQGLYNAVDDEPVLQGDFLAYLANETGRLLPPVVETSVSGGNRKRGITHKKVSNRRLRTEAGWVPLYPNFRKGYAAQIEESQKRI